MLETQARPVTPETVTPIKPSEALRLGRLLYPIQNRRGQWFGIDEPSACALGAIHAGWTGGNVVDCGIYDQSTTARLQALGIDHPSDAIGCDLFDPIARDGGDGDVAVLAYLEARGL